jgi:hypothetical protein
MKFVYLCQPYTVSPADAYEFALSLLAREVLYDSNATIFSPIVHYHETAQVYGLPHDFKFWLRHNLNYLEAASEVRVVCAHGLVNSLGCLVEQEYARRLKIPVRYYALDSALHSISVEQFNRVNLYDCLQQSFDYSRLLKEIQAELRGKRAGANTSELA